MSDTTEPIKGKIIHVAEDGWGFITSPEIEFERIFFHWTGLARGTLNFKKLERNMKVEFIPIEVPEKGWRAIRIKVLDDNDRGRETQSEIDSKTE